MGGNPYEVGIAAPERAFWAAGAPNSSGAVLPSISAGSDSRPRQQYVMPWGRNNVTIPADENSWVVDPTMAQLRRHTADALDFAARNPAKVKANAVLISAWNENDEGHWVVCRGTWERVIIDRLRHFTQRL